jgi:hypothetical protein
MSDSFAMHLYQVLVSNSRSDRESIFCGPEFATGAKEGTGRLRIPLKKERWRAQSKKTGWVFGTIFAACKFQAGDAFIAVLALLECYSTSQDRTGREGTLTATASETRCFGIPL